MADPVLVPLVANAWTLVAANVTVGQIHKSGNIGTPLYQTFVSTGNPAPVDLTLAVPMVGDSESISSPVGIDVYLWASGAAAVVRVDI